MSRWRVKKYDGQGVSDLGPVPGRMGKKQIRQYLGATAVREKYPPYDAVPPVPIGASTRAKLLEQFASGLIIAYDAGAVVYTAERDSKA